MSQGADGRQTSTPEGGDEILGLVSQLGSDAILVLDQLHRLRWASANAAALLGTRRGSGSSRGTRLRKGAPLALVLDDPRAADIVSSAVASGGPVRGELRQNGWRQVLRAVAAPLRSGPEASVLLVVSDITSERRLSRANRELIANLSHDLRTPLASLRLLAETLNGAARDDPEAIALFAGRIGHEAERMHTLVSGILDLARLEAGAEEPALEQVELLELARQLIDELTPQAREQQVGLRLLGAPTSCLADPGRLRRALSNVMDNAVKFTRAKGMVTVEVSSAQGKPTVVVSDTGVGIGSSELARIFDRFYTGDRSRSGRSSGLGLSIAKQALELQGGDIKVRSSPGRGTTVTLTMPAG